MNLPAPRALPVRSTLLVSLLLLFTLACVPATAGAVPTWRVKAPKDPVLVAIDRALATKSIRLSEAVAMRRTWRASARAARTARTRARRSNIRAVRAYATTLARRRGLTAPRLKPVFLTIDATTKVLGSRRAFPRHEQEVMLPREAAVFKYYSGRGIQFQPFESFNQGMSHLTADRQRVGAARRVANRMLELGVTSRSALAWEFFFPFGGPSTPWRSTIAQAQALQLYSRMATYSTEQQKVRYVAAADSVVRSFGRSTRAGGVASPEGSGSFYVMYSFHSSQRILNGHLQSLLSLWRYHQATGSTAAREAYDRGYRALVPIMPRFDTGDWSRYQYGQTANTNYHSFMTEQLQDLARETRDPFFITYARRFRIYLEEPAKLGLRVVLLPSLVMPRDGYRDTIPVRFELTKSARVTLIITDGGGMEVRRITRSGTRGINTIHWDGRDAAGVQMSDDSYTGRLITVDRLGRRYTVPITQPFIIEHDTEPPLPILATLTPSADGASTQVTINVQETASRWFEGQLFINGTAISELVRVDNGPITFTVARPRDEVATASIRFVDNSGNRSDTPLSGVLNPSTVSG